MKPSDQLPKTRGLTIAAIDNLYESTKKRRVDDESIAYPRSFQELREKVEQLAASSQPTSGIYGDQHTKLLSKYSFDAQQLRDKIEAFEPEPTEGPYISDVTDVDGFITRQTDAMIWNQILESTGRTPINSLQEVLRSKEQEWNAHELEKGQSEFIESLGHSSGGRGGIKSSSSSSGSSASSSSMALTKTKGGKDKANTDDRAFFYGSPRTEFSKGHAEIVKRIALAQGPRRYGKVSTAVLPDDLRSDRDGRNSSSSSSGGRNTRDGRQTGDRRGGGGALGMGNTRSTDESYLLYTGDDGDNVNSVRRPATEFVELINSTISKSALSQDDSMSLKDLEGYQDLMLMIGAIVQENSQVPAPPGAYSTVCYEAAKPKGTGVSDTVQNAARKEHAHVARRLRLALTIGCKRHMENQIREIWSEFVDSAVRNGQMRVHTAVEGQSSRQRIRSYVCVHDQMGLLRESSARIKNPRDNETPLWPFVYHCLRVGDLEGAEQELTTCAAAGLQVEEAILVVVRLFRGILGQLVRATNMGGADHNVIAGETIDYRSVGIGVDVDPSALLSTLEKADLDKALYACRELYEQEERKPEEMRNPYRLFVLNLVSLTDVDSLQHPSAEIEHYLWGSLWFIQWEGLLKLCGYDTLSPDALDNGESVLFEKFLAEGGERYFEAADDPGDPDYEPFSPFVYAKVLLCCQRFGDAVEYLWRKQRAFAAVHLMTVCLHYGLVLPHRKLTENPVCHSTHSGATSVFAGGVSQMYRVPSPANLLRVYVGTPFCLDYPEAATDYLMCLDSCWELGTQASRSNINPDGHYWEAERVASETTLAQELTHLLVSLHRPQVKKLCGMVRHDGQMGAGGWGRAGAGAGAEGDGSASGARGRSGQKDNSRRSLEEIRTGLRSREGDFLMRDRYGDRGNDRDVDSRSTRKGGGRIRSSWRDSAVSGPHVEYFSARSRGYLDTHFVDPSQVDYLLSRAAYHLLTELHSAESGILLYQLAGRYADVVTEMVNQLAQVATTPATDSQRVFWLDMSSSFFEEHVRAGDSQVVLLLEQEDQLGLVKILETTLDSCKFFDLAADGRLGDALRVADSMDLTPETLVDVPRLVAKAPELDPSLRKVLDALLVRVMDCTHQLYKQQRAESQPLAVLSSSSGGSGAAGRDMRSRAAAQVQSGREAVFAALKERARALVRFACDIPSLLLPQTPAELSRMDSQM